MSAPRPRCDPWLMIVDLPLVIEHESLHVVLGELAVLLERGEVERGLGFLDGLLGCGLGVVELR